YSPFRHFRLVEASKLLEVQTQHQHDRITVIPFDKNGQDLGSFLRSLVPARRARARSGRTAAGKTNLSVFWERYALEGITVVVPPREEDEILRGQHGFAYLGLIMFLQGVAPIIPVSATVTTQVAAEERLRNLLSFTGPIPNMFSREMLARPEIAYRFDGHDLVDVNDLEFRLTAVLDPQQYPLVDYGLITCIRNPWDSTKSVLVAAGCFAWGSQAAIRVLADEESITWILKHAGGDPFQVICRAEVDSKRSISALTLLDRHPDRGARRKTFRRLPDRLRISSA
ncbi:MAG: hypothetical protein ACREBC_30630, partial [Pyrinomonadaceae bacterium]